MLFKFTAHVKNNNSTKKHHPVFYVLLSSSDNLLNIVQVMLTWNTHCMVFQGYTGSRFWSFCLPWCTNPISPHSSPYNTFITCISPKVICMQHHSHHLASQWTNTSSCH